MTLTLDITRVEGTATQVKCSLDGALIGEFYGFGESMTDQEIEDHILADLAAKGYQV